MHDCVAQEISEIKTVTFFSLVDEFTRWVRRAL
jgi:hypothetical protein